MAQQFSFSQPNGDPIRIFLQNAIPAHDRDFLIIAIEVGKYVLGVLLHREKDLVG